MTRYQIETFDEVERRWVVVDEPRDSMTAAELAIIKLRTLGSGWDTGEYRIVPVAGDEPDRGVA